MSSGGVEPAFDPYSLALDAKAPCATGSRQFESGGPPTCGSGACSAAEWSKSAATVSETSRLSRASRSCRGVQSDVTGMQARASLRVPRFPSPSLVTCRPLGPRLAHQRASRMVRAANQGGAFDTAAYDAERLQLDEQVKRDRRAHAASPRRCAAIRASGWTRG